MMAHGARPFWKNSVDNLMARRIFSVSVLLVLAAPGNVPAADALKFPMKPVRFLIPVPPGGGADMLGRTLGQKLAEQWGQAVVIDNRGGASGTVAVDATAKAQPDGHTIVMGLIASITIAVSFRKLPYDPVTDLAPVTMLAVAQNLLVVHPSLPVASVKELIAVLKAKPGQYSYASAGNGTSPHLSAELFKLMTGTRMTHVPYKGAGPALIDLVGGQVGIYFGSLPATLPTVRSGKLRALAVSGAQRSALAPEMPTVAEAGVPGFESMQWYGVLAPAKTPPAILEKLRSDMVAALNQSDVRERLQTQGFEIIGNRREVFGDYIKTEIAKWATVVREAGIRAD